MLGGGREMGKNAADTGREDNDKNSVYSAALQGGKRAGCLLDTWPPPLGPKQFSVNT